MSEPNRPWNWRQLFDQPPVPWAVELMDNAFAMERAAIVKWLRARRVFVGGVAVETAVELDELADAIQAGEHLK